MTEAIANAISHEHRTNEIREFQKLSLSMSADQMIQRCDEARARVENLLNSSIQLSTEEGLEGLSLNSEILGLHYAFREKFGMTMHEYRVQQVFHK